MCEVKIIVKLAIPVQPVLGNLKADLGRMKINRPLLAGGIPARVPCKQSCPIGRPQRGQKANDYGNDKCNSGFCSYQYPQNVQHRNYNPNQKRSCGHAAQNQRNKGIQPSPKNAFQSEQRIEADDSDRIQPQRKPSDSFPGLVFEILNSVNLSEVQQTYEEPGNQDEQSLCIPCRDLAGRYQCSSEAVERK